MLRLSNSSCHQWLACAAIVGFSFLPACGDDGGTGDATTGDTAAATSGTTSGGAATGDATSAAASGGSDSDSATGGDTTGDKTSGDTTGGETTGSDTTGGDTTGGDTTGGDTTGGDTTGGDTTGGDTTGDTTGGLEECDPGMLCGVASYEGEYGGPEAPVYIRVYKAVGSSSTNPEGAVGVPDFVGTRAGPGFYQVNLEGYEGTVYVSAFLDVDESGSAGGPNARDVKENGLFSDPMGAFGGYTFEGDPATAPTPVEAVAEGVNGIDIQLTDSGVVRGTISGNGGPGATVLVGSFVPEFNGPFLHHAHIDSYTSGDTYLVAMPPAEHWRVRTTVGNTIGFYPKNPPPPPPTNTTPVMVKANEITSGIDITLM